MFRGRFEHTIDAKGRTSVPARYRDALSAAGERRIVITSALDPCLWAYTLPEWRAFEEKLANASRFDPHLQKIRRIVLSGAVELDFDDVGRILVPPTLREHANLKKNVLWAGVGRYAELWDKDDAAKHFKTADDDERRDIATRLAELGL